jgi:hypothetical protein
VALYAFDGTWNRDKPGSEEDTNVVWFKEAYDGPVSYQKGVGTRAGKLGRVVGGITGAGGRTRVRDALNALRVNLRSGFRAEILAVRTGGSVPLGRVDTCRSGRVDPCRSRLNPCRSDGRNSCRSRTTAQSPPNGDREAPPNGDR